MNDTLKRWFFAKQLLCFSIAENKKCNYIFNKTAEQEKVTKLG